MSRLKPVFPPLTSTASDPLARAARKNPLYFGVPFVLTMVIGSFALSTFTQTRYDLHDQKVSQVGQIPLALFV
jgi:cytochrome c oxidase assembly protein subunit 16